MKKVWDFGYVTYERERTFNLHSKIEDHVNDVHDYMKYIKFGYRRATDDAYTEIRHGRISREDGVALIKKYDSVELSSLEYYCNFLDITREEFYKFLEKARDKNVLKKIKKVIGNIWTQFGVKRNFLVRRNLEKIL